MVSIAEGACDPFAVKRLECMWNSFSVHQHKDTPFCIRNIYSEKAHEVVSIQWSYFVLRADL